MTNVWDQQENLAFGVRTHHIDHLIEFERRHLDIDKMAPNMVRRVKYGDEDASDLSILDDGTEWGNNPALYEQWHRAYQTDILGLGQEHAPVYEQSVRQMLQRYVELQKHDPVIIGSRVLDGICNGCAFGRHCRNLSDDPDTTDQGGLSVFAYAANDLGLTEQFVADGSAIATNGYVLKSVVGKLREESSDLAGAMLCLEAYGDPYNNRPIE